ncbi:hypothetical protein HDU97_006717 [Phlyctochytrium planicorne]|nr:hypothetical protein HDU97_006717 [Phlyctochytrium planicorne]
MHSSRIAPAYRLAVDQDADPDLFALNVFQRSHASRPGIDVLRDHAVAEAQSNEAELSRLKGKAVLYGNVIQLLDVCSKRFLSFNSKETVSNEPGSMPIELERYTRRECYFRILPKFRIRAEGEPVRIGDAIVLQSLKTEAYLNLTSAPNFHDFLGQNIHEATLSSVFHGWTMNLFRPSHLTAGVGGFVTYLPPIGASINGNPTTLQRHVVGGKFIRLYHKEKEGYITAASLLSMATNHFDSEGVDYSQVQLNYYEFDPLNPQDSSSSLVLWQVENASPFDGGHIDWNQPIRLRHAASNMYLQVEKKQFLDGDEEPFFVSLTPKAWKNRDEEDPTLFMFSQVNNEGSSVTTGSYVRLQNVKTATWLHATDIESVSPRGRTGSQGTLPLPVSIKIRDDKNRLYLAATKRKHLDDYFSVSIAEHDQIDLFNYVNSFIPWLVQLLIKERQLNASTSSKFPISSNEERIFRMILTSVIYFSSRSTNMDPMSREGTPMPYHQTLLRESSIIEAILCFLQIPFKLDRRMVLRTSIGSFLQLEGFQRFTGDVGEPDPLSKNVDYTTVTVSQDRIVGIDIPLKTSDKEASILVSDFKSCQEPQLLEIFKLAYRVVKQFLLGSDPANQFHVAREFDTIAEHLDLNVGAAEALMQLLSGNLFIVQSIGNQQILHFVNLIVRDRNPSYIKFLIALCHCNGDAIPRHQEYIARNLFTEKAGAEVTHRFYTRISDTNTHLEVLPVVPDGQRRIWQPLKQFFNNSLGSEGGVATASSQAPPSVVRKRRQSVKLNLNPLDDLAGLRNSLNFSEPCLFYAATLDLYKALCFGRNKKVIKMLTEECKILSLEMCKLGMLDEGLPFFIRASYCDLIRVAFVDIFPISPVLQDHVYPLSTVSEVPTLKFVLEDAAIDDGSLDMNQLVEVGVWICTFLKSHGTQVAELTQLNEFILSVLRLLRFLVEYGIFTNEDILKGLFVTLVDVLDGRNDIRVLPSNEMKFQSEGATETWLHHERFEYNEWFIPIIDAKIEICSIMELLLQIRLDMRVYMYIHCWFKHNRPSSAPARGLDIALGFPNLESLLSSILKDTAYFQLSDTLTPILLDLLRYDNSKLKKSSVRILHRLFSSLDEVFQLLHVSLILNDPSYNQSYDWIKNSLIVFIRNGVGSPVASGSTDDVILGGIDIEVAEKMSRVLKDLGKLCIFGSRTSGDSVEDVVIPPPAQESIPKANKVHQWVLRNLSVYQWVIDLIRNRVQHAYTSASRNAALRDASPRLSRTRSRESQRSLGSHLDLESSESISATSPFSSLYFPKSNVIQSELLLAAFEFLFYYANSNREHQAAIYKEFDLLLDATHPLRGGSDPGVSELCVNYLGGILNQNVNICMQISESQIQRILYLSGGRRPEYIRLLKSVVKSERKIIKRNQGLVMRFILEKRRQYIPIDSFLSFYHNDINHLRSTSDEYHLPSATERDLKSERRPSRLQVYQSTDRGLAAKEVDVAPATKGFEYMTELIDLFALCCEEKNGILQAMCHNILDVESSLAILNSSVSSFDLKRAILRLLVSAYLLCGDDEFDQKSEYLKPTDEQIWKHLKFGLETLREYVKQVPSRNSPTFNETDEYIFQGLFVFATNFMKKFASCASIVEVTEREIANDFVDETVNLALLLRCTGAKEDRRRRRVLTSIDAFRMAGFSGQRFRNEETATESLLEDIEVLNTGAESPSTAAMTPRAGDATRSIESKNVASLNMIFQMGLKALVEEQEVRNLKSQEFESLAIKFEIIVDDSKSLSERDRLHAYTKSLIEYLEQSVKRRGLIAGSESFRRKDKGFWSKFNKRDEDSSMEVAVNLTPDEAYDVKTLRILEWIVRREIEALDKMDRVEHPEEWSRLERRKVFIQEELNRLGCSLMAEKLVTSDRNSILSSSLRLMIVLLDGGNKVIQDSLERYWLGTREERFFYCIHEKIKESIVFLRDRQQLSASDARKASRNRSLKSSSLPMDMQLKKAPTDLRIRTLSRHGSSQNMSFTTPTRVTRPDMDVSDGQGSVHSLLHKEESDIGAKDASTDKEKSVAGSGGTEDGEFLSIRSIMRLLQLLVEGHNLNIQEYMRHQPDNVKTFDLVKDVVDYLHVVIPLASEQILPLVIQVFDTLIDFAQGCTKNQVTIFNAKIVRPVNLILAEAQNRFSLENAIDLKAHAMLCILSLLEDDTDEDTKAIFKEMCLTLDLESTLADLVTSPVHRGMIREMSRMASLTFDALKAKEISEAEDSLKKEEVKDEMEENLQECGYLYTMLLITLLPFMDAEQQRECNSKASFNHFKVKIGKIEILRELANTSEKRLYSVLFPIPAICSYLREDSKSRFLWMNKRWLKALAKGYAWWWWSAYLTSLLINVCNMMCMIAPTGDVEHDDFSRCHWFVDFGRTLLGLALSSAEFIVIQLPLLINRRKLENQIMASEKKKNSAFSFGDSTIDEPTPSALSFSEPKEMHWQDYLLGLSEPRALYHIIMVVFAILGLRFPSLYSIHLMDFVYRDEVLQGVISSVTVNWSSLSKTVILGVIITYIYSVISFVFFRLSFQPDNGLYCGSLLQCFITVLSYGLRAGGGVGDLLAVPVPQGESYAARIVLDLSFFLIVIVFLLNVIFGIIFDTFGQLREDRNAISTDLKSNCFICSIHASEFQRHSRGFDYHIKHEHNIWHYLFFLVHLQTKDPTELTSHETYVTELLLKNDISFFPVNRAMSLNRQESDDVGDRVKRMEDRVAALNQTIVSLTSNLKELTTFKASALKTSAAPGTNSSAAPTSVAGGLAAIHASIKLKNLMKNKE